MGAPASRAPSPAAFALSGQARSYAANALCLQGYAELRVSEGQLDPSFAYVQLRDRK